MIPVDAQIWTEPDVRRRRFSLGDGAGRVNATAPASKIALVDASRRNPSSAGSAAFRLPCAVIAPNERW